jgi:hypothetical protein
MLPSFVMVGLVPAIPTKGRGALLSEMPGTRPGMTKKEKVAV